MQTSPTAVPDRRVSTPRRAWHTLRRTLALSVVTALAATLVAATPAAAATVASDDVTDGLVAWWKLDERTGTVAADSSGNDRHGTVVGDATWLDGQGFVLAGGAASSGNAVRLPDDLAAGLQEITVALDVWVDPTLTGNHFVYNIGNTAVGTPQSGTGYLFSTTTPYRGTISTAAWGAEQVTNKGSNLAKGTWKHLTYSIGGGVGTLYENGIEVARNTGVTHVPAAIGGGVTTRNFIGRSAYAADGSFKGVVRDFRIYDRALAATEVADVSAASLQGLVDADVTWAETALGDTSAVVADLDLPTAGPSRTTVAWRSSDADVVTDDGRVTRTTEDRTVQLTATLSAGDQQATRDVDVTVRGVSDPDLADVEAELAALQVPDVDEVRGNITLPDAAGRGVALSWSSSDDSVIDPTGVVARPAFGEDAVDVTLTATLSKGEASLTREVAARVLPLPEQEPYEAYMFSYFTADTIEGEKIYFGASTGNDARSWLALNGGRPVITSDQGTRGLRDPFVIRSPEGDTFYMIATDLSIGSGTSWDASQRQGSKYLEVWESHDLVTWSEQRHVRVSPDNAGNTWAPEAYYDESIGAYVVFWASKLYAEDDPNNSGAQHQRMLYATTRDFRTFSEPQVWQDTGVSRIDSTVIEVDGTYHRYTKDESRESGCLDVFSETSTDLRAVTTATSTEGDWALRDTCIGRDAGTGATEGPSILAANPGDVNGEGYYLFLDEFSGRKYIPLFSETLGEGEDWTVPSSYTLPSPAPRHGSVFPITAAEHQRVLEAYLPEATSVQTPQVRTTVGTPATLPATVQVGYADGSSQRLTVTWADVEPADYFETPGEYRVSGQVAGTAIPAEAVIRVAAAGDTVLAQWDLDALEGPLAAGTTVPDTSGSGNDATVRGNGAQVEGDVLELPGGSSTSGAGHLELPRGMFDGQDTLTISTWLRNETGAGNYAAMFFGAANNPPAQYWLLNPRNPQGRFKSVITDRVSAGSPWTTETGISPTNAAQGVPGPLTGTGWQLYTTVIRPGSITGYLDGQKVGTVPTTRTVSELGSDLVAYVGRSSYPDPYYRGGVRDVSVWSTALDDATVRGLYFDGVDDEQVVRDALDADAAALDIGPLVVGADIDLPRQGGNGSTVTWATSDPAVVDEQGRVTRPATDAVEVTLTATLSLAGQQATRAIVVTVVPATPQGDVDLVALTYDLAIDVVSDHLVLPPTVTGVPVAWTSSDPDVVAADGEVRRADDERTVELTATFAVAGATAVRTFTVTVLARDTARLGTYVRTGDTDLTDVLHLAASTDGGQTYAALNNGRGVLYPELGTAQLGAPQLFRQPDGGFGLVAAEDDGTDRIHLFDTDDLVTYSDEQLVRFNDAGLRADRVHVAYDNGIAAYRLTFRALGDGQAYEVTSPDLATFSAPREVEDVPPAGGTGAFPAGATQTASTGVTAAEHARVVAKLGRLSSTGTVPFEDVTVDAGEDVPLPTSATMGYSSGSTANLPVTWDADDVEAVRTGGPGTYVVDGTVAPRTFPERLVERRADPDVTIGDDGWYYFTGSFPMTRQGDPEGYDRVMLRRARTIDALQDAEEVTIWDEAQVVGQERYIWAPELAKIGDRWFVLFTSSRSANAPFDIRPAVLEFTGDELTGDAAMDPASWRSLGYVQAQAGDTAAFTSFSLDMTHFEHEGVHYVSWAEKPGASQMRIATIDPEDPTRLTSPSVLISTPQYAWERNRSQNQEVNEGAAFIRNGDRLFLTFSASTVDDRYAVGLLSADADADLLDPASWTKTGYPLLTTQDEPDAFGPGHNSFTVDEYGNPVIVYHSRTVGDTSEPGEATDGGLFDPRRHARARLVLWDVDGEPVLTVRPEEQVSPEHTAVSITVVVEGETVPPEVVASVEPGSPDGADGWYVSPVTVGLDLVEGAVADVEYRLDGGDWTAVDGPVVVADDGRHVLAYRASVDGVPVEGSGGELELAVDRTAPTLTWQGDLPDDGPYAWGELTSDAPTCVAVDTTSGPAGCEVTGWSTSVGTHQLVATAVDVAGNRTVETVDYVVEAWRVEGFERPVLGGDALNAVSPGRAVPLRFDVHAGERRVTDLDDVVSITSTPVSCLQPTTATGPEQELDRSGLRSRAGTFLYTWRVPAAGTGCVRVAVTTADGSQVSAVFVLADGAGVRAR